MANDSRANVYADRAGPDGVWGPTPEIVDTDNASDASSPALALDPIDGTLYAVRVQKASGEGQPAIHANYKRPGGSWQPLAPRLGIVDVRGAQNPRVAVDPLGNAIVVYHQGENATPLNSIWACSF